MKKTYTRNELDALDVKFGKLDSVTEDKLPYAADKNHDKVKRELKIVRDEVNKIRMARDPKENEYQTKWHEMYKGAAKKDEKGQPIIIGEGQAARYDIGTEEEVKAFNEKVKALEVEYKEVVDNINKRNVEIQKFMAQPVELEFHEVPAEYLDTEGNFTASKEQLGIIKELFVRGL